MARPYDTGITFPFCAVTGIAGTGPILAKRMGDFLYHAPADIHLHHIRGRLGEKADAPCNIVGLWERRHSDHHQRGGSRLIFMPRDGLLWYALSGSATEYECSFYDADADVTTSRWAPCEHCNVGCEMTGWQPLPGGECVE